MKNNIDESNEQSIESISSEESIMEKVIELAPVSAKLDKKLLEKCAKKMKLDKKKGMKISWRKIWEMGMQMYLKEQV